MAVILGIDVGTQSLKAVLLDTDRGCLFSGGAGYEILIPEIGYAEEEPESWWRALKEVLAKMKSSQPKEFDAIEVIGLSGQMHGLVALDSNNDPLIPSIIWVDQRSKSQVERINSAYSDTELAALLHNRVFTGFGFPSLLWIKEERPEVFERIHKVCCPKDYLRMKLTGGDIGTDMSDASSMTGFDLQNRRWSHEVLEKFGLSRELFPDCHESTEIAGCVSDSAARETGLGKGIRIVYGSGDLAALLLGCGIYKEGMSAVNIGTGANYNCYSKEDRYDKKLRMQEFCNAVDRSYALAGAILSGGLSLSWLKNKILNIESYADVDRLASEAAPGSDGVVFLPYLGGERAPHMDYNATGVFFGLQHMHDKRHLCRAVLEGVTFALKDAESLIEENGVSNHRVVACGGGARSPLWLQIQADIFEKEVVVTEMNEQAGLGACIIAGIGAGIFSSAQEGCESLVRYQERRYEPNSQNTDIYRYRYEIYRSLYPSLKNIMRRNTSK
ncbi:MAG: xylulokinase [Clostridiales bacterium]|nr:xylulokinase [Clostridiales bacterium]